MSFPHHNTILIFSLPFSLQGNSLNVKKKYGMIKSRTKDMKITEVLHRMEQYKQEFIDFLPAPLS